jgi:hypothetical protein
MGHSRITPEPCSRQFAYRIATLEIQAALSRPESAPRCRRATWRRSNSKTISASKLCPYGTEEDPLAEDSPLIAQRLNAALAAQALREISAGHEKVPWRPSARSAAGASLPTATTLRVGGTRYSPFGAASGFWGMIANTAP